MPEHTLFYVEDDALLATVTTKALKKRAFNVHHFYNIADAQKGIENDAFSHALLDLKVDDGLTLPLIKQLIEQHPTIIIIILTGYASIATAVQAIKLGATNYISKPASVDEILHALSEKQKKHAQKNNDSAELMSVKRLEWEHIQRALSENDGNISETARQLKMHRRTLQRKLQKKPVAE